MTSTRTIAPQRSDSFREYFKRKILLPSQCVDFDHSFHSILIPGGRAHKWGNEPDVPSNLDAHRTFEALAESFIKSRGYKMTKSAKSIPFQTIDWTLIPKTEHKGEQGTAFWQTVQLGELRIRIVEYSKGYLADHWCQKGHIVHCLDGDFVSESKDGRDVRLTSGMTYVVSDGLSSHRSRSENGVRLMIIDGDFLSAGG